MYLRRFACFGIRPPSSLYDHHFVPVLHTRDDPKDGRGEGLTNMHRELEKCERALTEYLDMKKNVFPRFETHSRLFLFQRPVHRRLLQPWLWH